MTYHFAIPTGLNPIIKAVSTAQAQVHKAATTTDAWFALWLEPVDANQLRVRGEGAIKPSELHVTLAYLPEIKRSEADKLRELTRSFAQGYGPVQAQISEAARFTPDNDEGTHPLVYRLESPTLMGLRAALVKTLESNGFSVSNRYPVYNPHITIKYVPKDQDVAAIWSPDPAIELTLSRFVLVIGDNERLRYDLRREDERVGPVKEAMRARAMMEMSDVRHENAALVKRHLRGKHSQKTHSGGKAGGAKAIEDAFNELPQNLTLLNKKTSNSIVGKLAKMPASDLEKALKAAEGEGGQAGFVKSGLLRRAMKQRLKELKKQQATKSAALVEQAGARHTGVEYAQIQKMHDQAIMLGASCARMTERAGAKHNAQDRMLIQRIHDNAVRLGAKCEGMASGDVGKGNVGIIKSDLLRVALTIQNQKTGEID